ncbi:MAG TPA: PAS domain S-box protein [Candidatus Acidoferrum sp.]|jgi:PAS domain S-box-containing protein|nr:PAS domain S-box protein [Candidatus Acidoferrum sp.]
MSGQLRVLVVEDSVEDTFFVVRELQRGGFDVTFERVETHAGMQAALEARSWDLVICDYAMPQFSGMAALRLCQQRNLDIPFIMVSGVIGEESAVEMLKAGAGYYLRKDHLDRLAAVVKRELAAANEQRIRRRTEADTAYLASIVRSCNDAIIGKTLDGTIVAWNDGAERLYGYRAEEIIGRPISILIPTYRPEELSEILGQIARGERIDLAETVRLRKDGAPVEVSVTISPIRNAQGQVIGASSVARDISKRKQEESERLALIQDLTAALSHA